MNQTINLGKKNVVIRTGQNGGKRMQRSSNNHLMPEFTTLLEHLNSTPGVNL